MFVLKTHEEKGVLDERIWRAAMRSGLRKAAAYWLRTYMPLHFTREGGAKYHFAPRSTSYDRAKSAGAKFWRSYSGRKQRKYGHQNPLEFSGDSKGQAHAAKVTASYKMARVQADIPNFAFHPSKTSGNTMWDEIRAVTPDEIADLETIFRYGVRMEIDHAAFSGRATITIQGAFKP